MVIVSQAGAVAHHPLLPRDGGDQSWLPVVRATLRALRAQGADEALAVLVAETAETADADVVTVAVADEHGSRLDVVAGAGPAAEGHHGYALDEGLPALAIRTGQPVLIGDAGREPCAGLPADGLLQTTQRSQLGPLLAVAVECRGPRPAVLLLGRCAQRAAFDGALVETARVLADLVALVLEQAEPEPRDPSAVLQRITVTADRQDDRDALAHHLHDTLIQRLFAAGLAVEAAATRVARLGGAESAVQSEVADITGRLSGAVGEIDATIRGLRAVIEDLRHPEQSPLPGLAGRPTLQSRVQQVVGEVAPLLPAVPTPRISGPVEGVVPEPVLTDVLAVLRETLTNVARHSSATHVEVELVAHPGRLDVVVSDDGVGIGTGEGFAGRYLGLAELADRAAAHGGALVLGGAAGEPDSAVLGRPGTRVTWSVPLP